MKLGRLHISAGHEYEVPSTMRHVLVLWIGPWLFGLSVGGRLWRIDDLSNPFVELYFGLFSVELYFDVTGSFEVEPG